MDFGLSSAQTVHLAIDHLCIAEERDFFMRSGVVMVLGLMVVLVDSVGQFSLATVPSILFFESKIVIEL